MKKRYLSILILLIIILFCLSGCETDNKQSTEPFNNTEISRTNFELNMTNSNNGTENNSTNDNSNATDNNSNTTDNNSTDTNNNANDNSSNETSNNSASPSNNDTNSPKEPTPPAETELAQFSTTILDKTENRQHNIRLTCSKLNNLTLDSNQTFSFLNTIGETTAESGYKKAHVLVYGKMVEDYGGR